MKNSAVFSDVEGTLITGNSFKLFVEKGREVGIYSIPLYYLANFLAFAIGLLPTRVERVVQFYLLAWLSKGREVAKMKQVAEKMAGTLVARCKPASLAQLREHQAQGRKVILVSAMLHEIVVALAAAIGARGEGTHLVIVNGKYLSKLDGEICQREGKADRVRSIIKEWDIDPANSFAFGDTINDIPFMELFPNATVIDPDPILEQEAKKRGWTILRTS
jgi:HAD superfamily hydrolase (TIGR01490 family)